MGFQMCKGHCTAFCKHEARCTAVESQAMWVLEEVACGEGIESLAFLCLYFNSSRVALDVAVLPQKLDWEQSFIHSLHQGTAAW